MEHDEALVFDEVQCEGLTAGAHLHWSPTNNLLALNTVGEDGNAICLLDPSCPQEHTVLSLPRQGGAAEQVVSLQWSPAKQRSLLLAVTASGRCLVWSQPCPGAESDALVTIGDWHSEEACRTAAAPVAAKWLEEPSPWRWPPAAPGPSSQAHGVESRFGPHMPAALGSPPGSTGSSGSDRLHWVRPGTLAFASVLQDARLQVAWWSRASARSPAAWQQSEPVPLGIEGPLRCADVAAGQPCQIRVLAVREANPCQAAVIAISGNPTVLRPDGTLFEPTQVQLLATLALPCKSQQFLSASFQPGSGGTAALLLSTNSHSITVSRFQQDTSSAWSLTGTREADLKCAPCSEARLHAMADGAAAALMCTSASQTFLTLISCPDLKAGLRRCTPLPRAVLHEEALERRCTAVTGSPSACCLATAHPLPGATSGASLCLRAVGLLSGAAEPPDDDILAIDGEDPDRDRLVESLADRVCWAFVWRMPWWDALQLVRWRARDEPGLAARVLSLLDAALHREPYTPRPAYGQLLTGFKLQLLAGCPDPSARAVSMDLWAQSLLWSLSCQLKLLCLQDPRHKGDALQHHATIAPEDAAAVQPWLAWAEAYARFFFRCLARWQRERPTAAPDQAPPPDALPCVRLLCDGYFFKSLAEVLAVAAVALKGAEANGDSGPSSLRGAGIAALAGSVHAINRAVLSDQRAAGLTSPVQSEARGAHYDAAASAQATFRGAYHFHYFRTVGGIRPELAFLDPDTGEIVSPLAEAEALSDSQLAAEGRRLGLIRRPVQPAPARSRKRPIGAALPPLSSDDEGPFGVGTPELLDRVSHIRRAQWRCDRDAALGFAAEQQTREGELDIVTGEGISWSAAARAASVDSLCCTAGGSVPGATLFNAVFCSNGSSACPVTGALWRRTC